MSALTASEIAALHDDARRCAEVAQLTYVLSEHPGIGRRRRGKGWRFADAAGRPLDDASTITRITELAIPPAWRKVWISPDPDGHILATGEDERGRKQYIYHPRWRALRDMLNFYRLLVFAGQLPAIRAHVDAQLRRRTLDRDQVLAVMIAIIDASCIRVGNEVYAQENHSFGLSTLTCRHVAVEGDDVRFDFPAKSGKQWDVTVTDRRVARVVQRLLDASRSPRARLFAVDGAPVDSDDVNDVLREITGEHLTAKNFRTWGGTLAAFEYLRDRTDSERSDARIVNEALDQAADTLGNTRAVARKHYVHPHVLDTFAEHMFDEYLAQARPVRRRHLSASEKQLIGFLDILLDTEFSLLQGGHTGVR